MDHLLPAETAEIRAHADRAAQARREGMQLLHDRRTNEHFATSKSQPGTLHRVTLASCDCLGFVRHQHCRHHSALVVAHLLQEHGVTPGPSRRAKTCERMATPAPKPAPEQVSDVHTVSGARIGFVKVSGFTTEAWGYGPEGIAMLLHDYRSIGTEVANRAADRVHRHYESSHWAAPEARVYRPRTAA